MSKLKTTFALLFVTLAALVIHGYHPYAEDAEIYLPGIEKLLHPQLFPSGREFFESHAGLTFFPNVIAASVRLTHLPMQYALFAWYVAAIFLLLLACWELSGLCFGSAKAQLGATALVAALLTLPIAGTALYIMDQYLNPRNLAAFAAVFAVSRVLEGMYVRAGLWLIFSAAVHPLMTSFAVALCVVIVLTDKFWRAMPAMAMLFPFSNFFASPTRAYREAMRFHVSHFLPQWQWYEWLGLFGPIAILIWFASIAGQRNLKNLERLCRALVIYEFFYFVIALIIAIPDRFEAVARLQPLRSLLLVYVCMLIASGGLLAEFVLKAKIWRWAVLFIPLSAGMFFAQRELFPASAHIEWPWAEPKNAWAQAFIWIRENTPNNSLFAIDPFYMRIDGEDTIGFRALAQRSRLADASKDSGAVAMFPPLAEEWWEQFQAQNNWKSFSEADFSRLQKKYGISWVVLEQPAATSLNCPYQNATVAVCRL